MVGAQWIYGMDVVEAEKPPTHYDVLHIRAPQLPGGKAAVEADLSESLNCLDAQGTGCLTCTELRWQ